MMIYVLFAICALLGCFIGILYSKISRLETKIEFLTVEYRGINKEIDALFDCTANLSTKVSKNEEKIDRFSKESEEAEIRVAKKVEEEWNKGLQNMLAWSPFQTGEGEDT